MGCSSTGFIPLKPSQYMDSTLELSKVDEDLQRKYLQKGTMTSGVLQVPDTYSNEDK